MSLKCPTTVGDQFPASAVAKSNFIAMERVAPGCTVNQVVTDVVIKRLADIRELQPRWGDSIRSWAKGLGIYVVGWGTGAGILGGMVWGAYQVAEAHFGWEVYAAAITLELLLNKLGTGVTNLSFAYFLAVHEAGKRAAKISAKQDERTIKEKQAEVERFRKEIRTQLEIVYDDCGKYLSKIAEKKIHRIEEGIQFRQRLAQFERKFPLIETLLTQAGLNNGDIDSALQRLKTRLALAKETACELSSKPALAEQNVKILSLMPEDSVREIAIPGAIHRRIDNARRTQMGTATKINGYVGAVFSGIKTCALATVAAAAVGTVGYGGWYGPSALLSLSLPQLSPVQTAGCVAAVAIPVIGVIGKEVRAQAKEIRDNVAFVEKELTASKESLQTIYGSIATTLQPDPEKPVKLSLDLNKKLFVIREEIEKLRIVKDPTEILGRLNPRC